MVSAATAYLPLGQPAAACRAEVLAAKYRHQRALSLIMERLYKRHLTYDQA